MSRLSALLPETVPEASDADDIRRIITTLPGIEDGIAGEFNRRLDRPYDEDCHDANGRLQNVHRGEHGMDCVVQYLQSIHWESAGVPLDLAQNKLKRIVTELKHLCASNGKHRTISATAASAEAASTPSDNGEKVGDPAFEARMDYIFDVAVNPKNADN
ncbi:hypothetical protein C8R43DRAFT_1131880 [Mycena crocata]|nr:hypothetical protein C8R43DRAFT_1131880 [Mycena crocata]